MTVLNQPEVRAASLEPGLGEAISGRLRELGGISDESQRLTRLYLSPAHRRAADLVAYWMRTAGMSVRLDGIGSVVGRYEGTAPGAPALLIGSHIDSVRNAGRFDGTLGVVTGIAVVASLHAAGRRLPFAIEVVAFGDEEGVRFPTALGGSRAMAGSFAAAMLDERDAQGMTRREALAHFGCNAATIPDAVRSRADTLGYVEVHIEQGPVLEAEDLPVGIVTAINGASRGVIHVMGDAGHAGTVPMHLRRDALVAAAEMILAVERRGRAEPDLVATVGLAETLNGAVNVVPGRVRFTLDVRSPFDDRRRAAVADIKQSIEAIAAARGVETRVDIGYEALAAPCDPGLSDRLAQAVARCGYRPFRLASGAGHDAMAFRGVLPLAMLFVRCRAGLSHHPDEYAAPADIDAGARVLADFVADLAASQTGEPP